MYSRTPAGFANSLTALHKAMMKSTSAAQFREAISWVKPDALASMAITVDNMGKLPIDWIDEVEVRGEQDVQDIFSVVVPYMQSHPFKPLAEQLSISTVLSAYPNATPQLRANLQLACEAVNEVRTVIRRSSTHPETNLFPHEEKVSLNASLHHARNALYDDATPITYYESVIKHNTESAQGACEEMAYQALRFLQENAPYTMNGGIYKIENGDHVFLVMDSDERSTSFDLNHLVSQYGSAVYMDAWSGLVGRFIYDDLKSKMGGYKQYALPGNTWLNVVTKFNPFIHRPVCKRGFILQHEINDNLIKNRLRLFDDIDNFQSHKRDMELSTNDATAAPLLGRF